MVISAATYVWSYEDFDGNNQSFDVAYSWRSNSDSSCTAPTREVRAEHIAFHVSIPEIDLSGKKSGIAFNVTGEAGFTVQGLVLGFDFETLAQRGDPESYSCINRFNYCLTQFPEQGEESEASECLLNLDQSYGGPSGECSTDFLLAMSALSAAEIDDLLGSQAIIFERIHGYQTAQDLFDTMGVGWGGSFQVDLA